MDRRATLDSIEDMVIIMNLLTKNGPRFCADAAGASAIKRKDPLTAQLQTMTCDDAIKMAREVARDLVSGDPGKMLAAIDRIRLNPDALVHSFGICQAVYDEKGASISQTILSILSEMVKTDVDGIQNLDVLNLVAEQGWPKARTLALGRLEREIETHPEFSDCQANMLVARATQKPETKKKAFENMVNRFTGSLISRGRKEDEDKFGYAILCLVHYQTFSEEEVVAALEPNLHLITNIHILGIFVSHGTKEQKHTARTAIEHLKRSSDFEVGLVSMFIRQHSNAESDAAVNDLEAFVRMRGQK